VAPWRIRIQLRNICRAREAHHRSGAENEADPISPRQRFRQSRRLRIATRFAVGWSRTGSALHGRRATDPNCCDADGGHYSHGNANPNANTHTHRNARCYSRYHNLADRPGNDLADSRTLANHRCPDDFVSKHRFTRSGRDGRGNRRRRR